MKSIPVRAQLGLVAAFYAIVLATAALLVYGRHLQYVHHPEDVAAAGGMYAAGDWMLEIFIGCMLLVPTFVLVRVIRKSEHLYAGYSKDPAWPESDCTDLPGSAQHPGREPRNDGPGLDLHGSVALLADRDCGTGGQPVSGTV
jgi:hypothetical protein